MLGFIMTVGLGLIIATAILTFCWWGVGSNLYALGLVWRLMYGRKHRFSEPVTVVTEGHAWPLNTCKRCNLHYGLDGWQMDDLPPSMAYGCPGTK